MSQQKQMPSTVVIQRFDQMQTLFSLLREDIGRMDNQTEAEIDALKKKSTSCSHSTMSLQHELLT